MNSIPNKDIDKLAKTLEKSGVKYSHGHYSCLVCGTMESMLIDHGEDGSLAFSCKNGCDPPEIAALAWPYISEQLPLPKLDASTDLPRVEPKQPQNLTELVWMLRDIPPDALSANETIMLIMLESRGDRIFPNIDTLAANCKFHRNTVIRTMKSLEEKQVLEVNRRPGLGNHYSLNLGNLTRLSLGSTTERLPRTIGIDTSTTVVLHQSHSGTTPVPQRDPKNKSKRETEVKNYGSSNTSDQLPGSSRLVLRERQASEYGNSAGSTTQVLPINTSYQYLANHLATVPDGMTSPEIQDAFNISQPYTSQLLTRLREQGKVANRLDRNRRIIRHGRAPAWFAVDGSSPVDRYYLSAPERGSHVRIAGNSRPRPQETEAWLTQEEYEQNKPRQDGK
jgi:hypothetical protein